LGTYSCEQPLGTCSWARCLGTLLGNLFLGTFGNLWEPVPGNLAWEPGLGTPSWEPGNLGTLGIRSLAAPTCSDAFITAEDPKLTLLGNKKYQRLPGCQLNPQENREQQIRQSPRAASGLFHRLWTVKKTPRVLEEILRQPAPFGGGDRP